ncbi:chorismate--pyruvate lyase [Pseudomonas sp. TE3786]
MPHAAFADTAHWLTAEHLQPAPAEALLDWLFDQGSLTRRLIALSSDAFSVTPLHESWQTLRSDECQALNVREGSVGWVREVFLRGHDQPWIFARSVAARGQLINSDLHMDELGSRSLGELLFSDQAFSRGEMQVCRYPQHWLPAEVSAEQLWARRSCFARDGLSVLVAEVFLPPLWVAAGVSV